MLLKCVVTAVELQPVLSIDANKRVTASTKATPLTEIVRKAPWQ